MDIIQIRENIIAFTKKLTISADFIQSGNLVNFPLFAVILSEEAK